MTDEQLTWVKGLVSSDKSYWFYVSRIWKRVRKSVMDEFNWECQPCKRKHKYSRANTVHHIYHLEEYPEYALDPIVIIDGVEHRNLEPCCRECHEEAHNHRHTYVEPITEERW